MQEKDKRKKVTISLYDKDIAELEAGAKHTGGNKSEYVRMLLHFIVPHSMPDKRFWELMNELYAIHNVIKDNAEENTNILMACEQLEDWIMKFQSESTLPWEVG